MFCESQWPYIHYGCVRGPMIPIKPRKMKYCSLSINVALVSICLIKLGPKNEMIHRNCTKRHVRADLIEYHRYITAACDIM